jgi:hypothetical protein
LEYQWKPFSSFVLYDVEKLADGLNQTAPRSEESVTTEWTG